MRSRALVIVCALLTGCSDSAVKDAVKEQLFDPDSAQFGAVSYSDSDDMACVEVNAKNRMGGYTGRKQAYLQKTGGEWTFVSDFDESHDECVDWINHRANETVNSAVGTVDRTEAQAAVPRTPVSGKPGVVTIIATEPVWLQVTDGGRTLFSGELSTGQRYEVPQTASAPQMSAGKPEALRILVGEREIPAVGTPGSVASGVSLKGSDLLR